ncbi:MAG: glycosyltransferase family 39 protein [Chloroflexi bacterium]|nr:glycosyltransferase family 39 protein [Chloroflexota bacterium]
MTDDASFFAKAGYNLSLTSRQSFVLALALMLLAAFLRFTYLVGLPNGFSENEIINIRLVDNVRQGDIYVFFPGEDGGREGGYHVIAAFATALVGDGPIGFRILSSWLSLLSVAIIFTLGNHLFNPLVGLMAATLVTVNMSSILLARTVSSDVMVAFLVSAAMLTLARSLPVYRRTRVVTSNVVSFTALGTVLGLGLYLHPSSLFIAAGALAYIAHLVFIRNQMFRQRRSYTGFAMLLLLIISMPYLISTINLPQFSALQRILTSYGKDLPGAIIAGLQGIVLVGDLDPLHNLPGRPLVDIISAAAIVRGFVACVLRRHRPRFMLLLIMFLLALPAALVVPESPNFARMAVILPQLALFFGMGIYAFLRLPIFSDRFFRRMALAGTVALLALNLIWTWQDLVADWRENEQVMQLVNGELGQIAHYLDHVGDEVPVVFCNPDWDYAQPSPKLNDAEKVLLMMNRDSLRYHEANCANTLLLTNGGELQRLVFFDTEARTAASPHLQAWLELGESVVADLPRNSVIELETVEKLAGKAGVLTTTAPVSYAREVAVPEPISPAIRFGGNLTLLGYEPDVSRSFLPGETVDIITYWRVDGELPPDVTLFTQILADPVTPIVTRHYIGVNPTRMRERDIFIQVIQLQLPAFALPGEYAISIGLYRERFDQRLPVLKDGQAHGDRLFLYTIDVVPAEETETSDA